MIYDLRYQTILSPNSVNAVSGVKATRRAKPDQS